MRSFDNTSLLSFRQQAFHVTWQGHAYFPYVSHCTLGEVSSYTGHRRSGRHSHPDIYHLVVMLRGRNRICVGNRLLDIQPGSLVLVDPGQDHSFAAQTVGSLAYSEVTFRLARSDGAALRFPFSRLLTLITGWDCRRLPAVCLLNDAQNARMRIHFEDLHHALKSVGPLRAFDVGHSLCGLLGSAAKSRQVTAEGVEGSGDARMRRVREFIEANLGAPADLAHLAAIAGLSRSHLVRQFKATTGEAPIAYRNRMRIEAAKNLLQTTNLSLAEIAERLGYCDPYHLGHVFKKALGLSPGRFRRTTE